MDYTKFIQVVEDFPIKGISFKDVTPLVADKEAFSSVINDFYQFSKDLGVTKVIGPESRGFVFGCPLAEKLHCGFVMARKPGKLPGKTIKASYKLEYGEASLFVDVLTLKAGDKVIIIDDLIATGGTIEAIIDICRQVGAQVIGICSVIGLTSEFNYKEKFKDYKLFTIMEM